MIMGWVRFELLLLLFQHQYSHEVKTALRSHLKANKCKKTAKDIQKQGIGQRIYIVH